MPLIKSASRKAVSENIREMVHAGHPQQQAIAAALNVARKARADGGGTEYKGEHAAPDKDSGAPMHDVTGIYPADVYGPNGFRYYGDQGNSYDREAFSKMQEAKGRPYFKTEVYRAVPKDKNIKDINPGDWVAIHRQYAKDHGESTLNGNYKILKKTVKARDLFTAGDSHHEWGYHPQPSKNWNERIAETNEARRKFGMPLVEKKEYQSSTIDNALRIARATGGPVILHTGPIKSAVAGRTDHLPMHVPSGAYVLPADIVSAMGEGNTEAGYRHVYIMFGGTPYSGDKGAYGQSDTPYNAHLPTGRASGGTVHGVPIVAAGGEVVLSPEQVMWAGDGDLDRGHRVLDEFVKRKRAETVKTLTKLPSPRRD